MTPTEQAADRVKALVDDWREDVEAWNGNTDSDYAEHLGEELKDSGEALIETLLSALTALQARVGELEGALKPLLSCLDDIETYQRRPERGDWGVECAWPHKAEAVPTRTPQVSHEFREAKQNNPSPTTGADLTFPQHSDGGRS